LRLSLKNVGKMGRKTRIWVLALMSLGLALFILPKALEIERIRTRVSHELGERFHGDVTMDAIRWEWLPTPHLRLENLRAMNEEVECVVPESEMYPAWRALFRGEVDLGDIVFKRPRIHLSTLNAPAALEEAGTVIPPARITVTQGSISVNAGETLPGWLDRDVLAFSNADAVLELRDGSLSLNFFCTPPHGKSLELHGSLNVAKRAYTLELRVEGLMPHRFLGALAEGSPVPVDSEANFRAVVDGEGFDQVRAAVRGDFPCLKVRPRDREMLLSCGAMDLLVEKAGRKLSVAVHNLELMDPGLRLKGSVTRTSPDDGGQAEWDIQIEAADIDLAGIREKVLALYGGHSVADQVCGIVLGGRARSAAFSFKGPTSDFRRLEAMTIAADVESAPIYVPGAALTLDWAKGPITVRDGVLEGHGLSAQLGRSLGKDCTLVFQLTGDDRVLRLDLDLDADLAVLPPILGRLVRNAAFRNELARFSDVRGRASGHLSLGDRLEDLAVSVSDVQAEVRYGRIPWPVKIYHGGVLVAPRKVVCKDVKGEAGPHIIRNLSGSVLWDGDLNLNIASLKASVDADSLFMELCRYPALEGVLSRVLRSIEGPLEITRSSLSGPVETPVEWRYSLDCESEGLTWDSPLLPGPVLTKNIAFSVDEEKLLLASSAFEVSGRPLSITGELYHHLLQGWHGSLEFDGVVSGTLSEWLRAKAWIPPPVFPKAPCTLQGLKVTWNPEAVEVKGTIIPETGLSTGPGLRLDMSRRPGRFLMKQLEIWDVGAYASLRFDFDTFPGKHMDFSFDGILEGPTLYAFLRENQILSGTIEGSCKAKYDFAKSASPFFKGVVDVEGLKWPWGLAAPFDIQHVMLGGSGKELDLDDLVIGVGKERLQGNGSVSIDMEGVELDLVLRSDVLTWQNLSPFIVPLREYSDGHGIAEPADRACRVPGTPPYRLRGSVDFSLGRFEYAGQACRDGACDEKSYVWQPLKGRVEFLPDDEFAVSVSEGRLCGMATSGIWRSSPAPGVGSYHIKADRSDDTHFQEVLRCLGLDQEILDGRFDLDASLKGPFAAWPGGSIRLHSEDGRIRKLTLLAKIFSVINVTDLFSGGLPDFVTGGFAYSDMVVDATIKDNDLFLDRAIVRGEGLNLFARGEMHLNDELDCDMVVLIAPFKTVDTIVNMVPVLGRAVGGEHGAIVTIPVGVKGPLRDPRVTVLPPDAVGEAFWGLVKDTLKLPLYILQPIRPSEGGH
jgi:hypothetical protein